MELRHLQTLIAVAEEGSFSRAAARLRIAQSAVSRTIRDLERELGRPLFDRSTHHVELTVAGRLALDHARATLAAAHALRGVTACPLSCDESLSAAGEEGAAMLAAKRAARSSAVAFALPQPLPDALGVRSPRMSSAVDQEPSRFGCLSGRGLQPPS